MNTQIATEAGRPRVRRSSRALVVLSLGPLTLVAGILWAALQPYRITLLHPHDQGFWWLVSEPPLYVILVGLLFHFLIAPGVVADFEEAEPR